MKKHLADARGFPCIAAILFIAPVAAAQVANPATAPKSNTLPPEAYQHFNAHAFYTAGQYLYSEQNKNDEAIVAYSKAIEIDPMSIETTDRRFYFYESGRCGPGG